MFKANFYGLKDVAQRIVFLFAFTNKKRSDRAKCFLTKLAKETLIEGLYFERIGPG